MKGVKIAVAVMSVMIILCFVFLIAVIAGRIATPSSDGFGQARIFVPPDCALADAWSDKGRVYLRYDGEGACRQVVILDEGKGAVMGRIVTETAP